MRFYMQGSKKSYTKRKQLGSSISSNKLDGFITSYDWWNVCKVELLEGYSFWNILENIWNSNKSRSFLKALPLNRCNGVMTLALTDQWPGMITFRLSLQILVESFYLKKKKHISGQCRKFSRPLSRLIYRDKICFSPHVNNVNKLNMRAQFSLCHCFTETLNALDHTRIL